MRVWNKETGEQVFLVAWGERLLMDFGTKDVDILCFPRGERRTSKSSGEIGSVAGPGARP